MKDFEKISKEEIKDKLLNLEEHMGDYGGLLNEFGSLMYDKMNPVINSMGFLILFHTLIMDLKRGEDSRNNKFIKSELVGMNSSFYNVMIHLIPRVAEVVFGKEFFDQVVEHHHGVMNEMSKLKG